MRNWNFWFWFMDFDVIIVESLPMRNWNVPKTNCQWKSCIVESLPMRNWNYILLLACVKHLRWEPTYEELKHELSSSSKTINRVESLPMRNWNFKMTVFAKPFSIVLRAYLWGIETLDTNAQLRKERVESWEPTYEELKLPIDSDIHRRLSSFVESLPMRNWNQHLYQSNYHF